MRLEEISFFFFFFFLVFFPEGTGNPGRNINLLTSFEWSNLEGVTPIMGLFDAVLFCPCSLRFRKLPVDYSILRTVEVFL